MRKQFNLQDWLKDESQKIETRNGRPAHYIGLDRAGWQVFEIFRANGTSEYKTYHDSYLYDGPGESTYDLFIAEGEKLTPFEVAVKSWMGVAEDIVIDDSWVKNCAKELLSLARKQLIKEGYIIEKKDAEHYFPELKESEDERIREGLIEALKTSKTIGELKFVIPEPKREKCIAYLEKQKEQKEEPVERWQYVGKVDLKEEKEQKPNIELIQKSWYMEGYHDCEFGYEPRWIIKTGEGGPRYEENPKYGQHIKEKSVEWEPQPESLEALMYAIEGKWEMIKPTSYLSRRLEDLFEGLVNAYNVDESYLTELHETALTGNVDELRELKNKIEASMDSAAPKKQDYSGLNDFERAIHRGFLCAGVENVPVNIIKETAQDCLAHLPAEWSEEDEKMLNNIEYILHKDISYTPPTKPNSCTGSGNAYYTHQTEIDWLKSLRPSWKPSKEPEEPKYYQHFDPDC